MIGQNAWLDQGLFLLGVPLHPFFPERVATRWRQASGGREQGEYSKRFIMVPRMLLDRYLSSHQDLRKLTTKAVASFSSVATELSVEKASGTLLF